MATNLSSLATITTAANGLANLILVSPQNTIGYQPQNAPSYDNSTSQLPPAIVFHYEGEQTALLESDITDHYVEDNTAIQDQIALKPETITTHGFIGELNDLAPNAVFAALQTAAQKLLVISAYTPNLSVTALEAYNEAVFLYQTGANVVNSAVQSWASITGSGGESVINGNGITVSTTQNKQQQIFAQFYGYWKSRTLFTVQTPWAVFQDMAIKSLRSIQDAETNVISDFEITFKLIRFATTSTTGTVVYDNTQFQDRLFTQGADPTDLGTSTPQLSSLSLSSAIGNVV